MLFFNNKASLFRSCLIRKRKMQEENFYENKKNVGNDVA